MMVAALLLAYAGWMGLCLAMPRHQRPLLQRELDVGQSRGLRLAGWLMLGLSFAAAVAAQGWQLGSVAWVACLAVSGIGLVLALPYRPRGCLRFAVLALVLAPLLSILG
ncbi:MAG TPA: DUF3325 domain-containing protein [Solimonas sp.]